MDDCKTYSMYSLATEMTLQHKPQKLIENTLITQGCTSAVAADIANQVFVCLRLLNESVDRNIPQARLKTLLMAEGFPSGGADAVSVQVAHFRHEMNMPEWLRLMGFDRQLPTFVYMGLALTLLLSGGLGFAALLLLASELNGLRLIKLALVGMAAAGLTMLLSLIVRSRNSRR